jgi:glycerol-3-phosphate dehydrogenase
VLSRRVPLLLVARDQGLGVVERVAGVGAAILGWSESERARQIEHYREVVAHSRRFRDGG